MYLQYLQKDVITTIAFVSHPPLQLVKNMKYDETLKNLDLEIRRLKDELNQLERARSLIKRKQTDYAIVW
jgi:hypothetical protein